MTSIIDLSAGNRAVWFDKHNRLTTFVDIRTEVGPDLLCSSADLPEELSDVYDLCVFDPPHVNFGSNANMSKTYGYHTTSGIRDIITGTAREAHRVCKRGAFMAFKWNTHDQKLDSVLALMDKWWEPLFGHKVAQRNLRVSSTYWVMLLRRNEAR